MSQEFKIEIISPDNSVYTDETSEVVLPCFEGQITILKDHISFNHFFKTGLIEVDKKQKFYVEDGTVEFSDNKLIGLSTTVLSLKRFSKKKKSFTKMQKKNF